MILGNGEAVLEGLNCPVTFTIATGTPTHYRLAESSADLSTSTWIVWSTNILYKFAQIGSKVLYGQIKNQVSKSSVVNTTIQLIEAPIKVVLGFNGTGNQTVQTVVANGDTTNQINLNTYNGWAAKPLYSTNGEPSEIIMNFNSNKYPTSSLFPTLGAGNWSNPSNVADTDDTGVYPNAIYKICQAPNQVSQVAQKMRVGLDMPAGTYRVRILSSTSYNYKTECPENCKLGIYDGEKWLADTTVGTGSFTMYKNKDYNATMTFTVDTLKTIYVVAYYEGSPNESYRPSINLIELTKLS